MRSPTGPPMIVPAATAARKMKRSICALCTDRSAPNVRRFGMAHNRTEANEARRAEHNTKPAGSREREHAEQREAHADRERVRPRVAIRVETDHRLQQRAGQLQHERDEADLREIELEVLLEDWIDGRNQRLHHVVEHVAETESRKNIERRIHAFQVYQPLTTNH